MSKIVLFLPWQGSGALNENEDDDENGYIDQVFNFDFVETAMLVTRINKFPRTRLFAVFNSQFSIELPLARAKIKIVYSVKTAVFSLRSLICENSKSLPLGDLLSTEFKRELKQKHASLRCVH